MTEPTDNTEHIDAEIAKIEAKMERFERGKPFPSETNEFLEWRAREQGFRGPTDSGQGSYF